MLHLLVKNEIKDFDRWLEVFRTEDAATKQYGLTVEKVWRDPQHQVVFFLMRAESIERANAFMTRPESARVGERAGVTGGSFHFLTEVEP
jgi:hypothetical protein